MKGIEFEKGHLWKYGGDGNIEIEDKDYFIHI